MCSAERKRARRKGGPKKKGVVLFRKKSNRKGAESHLFWKNKKNPNVRRRGEPGKGSSFFQEKHFLDGPLRKKTRSYKETVTSPTELRGKKTGGGGCFTEIKILKE